MAIFIPWFWQEEYRKSVPLDFSLTPEEILLKEHYQLSNEQILWRRTKLGLAFDEKQVKILEAYLSERRQKDDAA